MALGYKNGNEFRKEVLLADLSGKIISNQRFKNLDSLFQDCQGHLFAFCADSALELKLTQKQVSVRNGYQRSFIVNFIAPVCGISDSMIFLKKSSANHQYDNYYAVSDSQNVMLIYSTGGLMKERQVNNLRNNWKTMAQIPVTAGNHDFLVPVGGMALQQFLRSYEGIHKGTFSLHHQFATEFRSVLTKMIPYGNNQLIFDREAATIFWLDKKGEVIKEVGMITKLKGIFYQDAHLDTGTGRIYLEYPQGTFTHFIEINPETGQEVRRFMVTEFKHIERCEFLDDRLYFLYQPDSGKRMKKVITIRI